MQSCIDYVNNLWKVGKIQQPFLDYDSEKNMKISFIFHIIHKGETDIYPKKYEFVVKISEYRFMISSKTPLSKEEQDVYQALFGPFVQREEHSRHCIYYTNKWATPSLSTVQQKMENMLQHNNVVRF